MSDHNLTDLETPWLANYDVGVPAGLDYKKEALYGPPRYAYNGCPVKGLMPPVDCGVTAVNTFAAFGAPPDNGSPSRSF